MTSFLWKRLERVGSASSGATGFSPSPPPRPRWCLPSVPGGHGGRRVLPRALFLSSVACGVSAAICTLHRKRIGSINVLRQNLQEWMSLISLGANIDLYAQINVSGAVSSRNPRADVTAMLPFFSNSALLAVSRINSTHSLSPHSRYFASVHPSSLPPSPLVSFAPHARGNNACSSHQERDYNLGHQCQLAPFFSMWHLGSQRSRRRSLGVYSSPYVPPSFIHLSLIPLISSVDYSSPTTAVRPVQPPPLGGNSLLLSISLRTPCTGGTSDADSWPPCHSARS